MNIFIISPNKELADTLMMGLNREGYNVTFASNINESIICFKL